MAALTDIQAEVAARIVALAPEGGRTARARERFRLASGERLEEMAGQSRLFEVLLALEGLDDTFTAGPERWLAQAAVRVRYEADGPVVRAMAREAAARDGQRISAEMWRPDGWPACARVSRLTTRVEDVLGNGGAVVAHVLAVEFSVSFFEEV